MPLAAPTTARILLLEDSDADAALIGARLAGLPFEVQVRRAASRAEFLALLQASDADIVLADYALPGFDGLAALRLAQQHLPDTPFVFISGVGGEDIATDALRHGATDYVLKRHLPRLPKAVERALAETRERAQRRRVEAALRTSEANTRLAVSAAQLGMWHYLPETQTLNCDERCQAILGVPGRPRIGRDDFLRLCHPGDRAAMADALQAAMQPAGGGHLLQETRTLSPDGADHWIVLRGQALFDAAGRCTRLIGVLQDMTEQKVAAARQHQSEMLFRLATEAADIGVWDLDLERNELWFDDRVRTMAGLPAGASLGPLQMLEQVVYPQDRHIVEAGLRSALQPGGSPEVEFQHRTIGLGDKRPRWIAIKGRRIVGQDGRERLVGTARDITAQRRTDEALRHANEALEERVAQRTRERDRIWNLSADLMQVCRLDGTLVAVNPAWERLLGWRVETLLESRLLDLMHADDIAAAMLELQSLERGAPTVRFDSRLRRRDGQPIWIRWTASPDNGLIYAVGRDVTAERLAADELAAANRELKAQIEERARVEDTLRQMQRLEAVGQLTSGVAHDFNNLLTVVMSNVALIRRLLQQQAGGPDARVLQRLESMRDAAERGAKLTAQLLAFSRRQRLEPQTIDLNDTVLGMRDLLQTTLGGSVSISTALHPALWRALVDPTQLELIILNLAINARDAMEVGGALSLRTDNISLAARPGQPKRPEEPEPGDYVALTVTDTGSGMTPEVLAKAFEPFFTTKEVGRGSGLGLAQVYGFAKQSGGGVRIDTTPGSGTAVHVFIPRAAGADCEGEALLALPRPAKRAPHPTGHTLLLVDDDRAVREVTAATLLELGYCVVEAANASAALELLGRREDVQLVIADFAMPGMNGAEMAGALRHVRPGLPVLFVTGFADLTALKDVPEDHVLLKPLRDDELAERLQRLLPAPRPEASML